MPEPHAPPAETPVTEGAHPEVDWEAAERSPEFQELIAKRKRFVLPATIFFLAWYLAFILLAGYAEDFMGESVIEGLTVGYVLALSQFVMVWGLCWLYIRKSDREFDPLSRRAAERAGEVAREAGLLETVPGAADEPPPPAGRFQRETGEAAPR